MFPILFLLLFFNSQISLSLFKAKRPPCMSLYVPTSPGCNIISPLFLKLIYWKKYGLSLLAWSLLFLFFVFSLLCVASFFVFSVCSSVFYFFVSSLALICFSLIDRFSLFLCFFNFGCTSSTALDILIETLRDLRDMEIEEFLIA